ncbi:MAG: hypothetical protein ACR2QO_12025 [Acidimicrobiales bacterium]
MPEILRARSRRGLVGVLLTFGLVASACGSDATETSAADAESTDAETAAVTTDAETEATGSETSAAANTEAASESTEGEATDTPEPATENLFPDVDVVNIVDGSTVNLAQELGGGDLPVLLWFWAPH